MMEGSAPPDNNSGSSNVVNVSTLSQQNQPPPQQPGPNFQVRHFAPQARMAIPGQPPGAISVQGPNMQSGTVYLIRGQNGELQLVRLTATQPPNPGGPAMARQMTPQQMGQAGIRFHAPQGGIPGQMQQGAIIGGPVPHQGMQLRQPAPVPARAPPPMVHNPAAQPQIPSAAQNQAAGQAAAAANATGIRNVEDALIKAKQFFQALLSMSKQQSANMYATARDLLQQLVDGHIDPDEFASRLQEELKSTPQPILAPLLRMCLTQMRLKLLSGELQIDGINPPPPGVLSGSSGPPFTAQGPPQERKPDISTSTVKAPPAAKSAARKTASKSGAASGSSGSSGASSGTSDMQHPVYSQIEQLNQGKPEKAKPPPKPTATKALSKSKKASSVVSETKTVTDTDSGAAREGKEQKGEEEDLNDVTTMCGVNLNEESARLSSIDIVGSQARSVDDQPLVSGESIRKRVSHAVRNMVNEDVSSDVLTIISHAVEARIRNVCEKLNVIAEHKAESVRGHEKYRQTHDLRPQLKFLEEMDKVEKRKREEEEKEALLRAAKSRNRPEDPEHMKLKQKAKELQRMEQEEMRTKEANQAALQAVGSRKRAKPDGESSFGRNPFASGAAGHSRLQPIRPHKKRVTISDVIFFAETNPKLCKSTTLYQLLQQIK